MEALRLGVIGTGSVVREIYEHLYFRSRYSDRLRVQAICDLDAGALASFGNEWSIPDRRRYESFHTMLEEEELDAVAVNTPDHLHTEPTLAALERGVDVILPKPTAEQVEDVHTIVTTLERTGRIVGVDFHKREDPVVQQATARIAGGAYGSLQSATFHMVDRLLVADPNHTPRFFTSPDFAARNSPVSFLTSHMADTFIYMTGLRPLEVRAVGYRQKLPSLKPVSVDGYDLVDTGVLFEGGVWGHFITGWALPNTADCLTVQSGRMVFSDGMLDLWDNHYGYREITARGVENPNVQFLTFAADGSVSGYGLDSPGRILETIARARSAPLSEQEGDRLRSPYALGFYTTLICECALASLEAGGPEADGAVVGRTVEAKAFLSDRIGSDAARYYGKERP